MKKVLLFSISLLVIFSLCGCGVIVAQNKTGESAPVVIEVSASTPAALLTPTIDPILSTTPNVTPNDQQSQLAAAQDIEGLTKVVQDTRIIYTYDEGNPYGGEVGEYAGEYSDRVDFVDYEGNVNKSFLSIVMMPEVVEYYLSKQDSSDYYFPIPVDISKLSGDERFTYIDNYYDDTKTFEYKFDGVTLPLVCIGRGREDINSDYYFYVGLQPFPLLGEITDESKNILLYEDNKLGIYTRFLKFFGNFSLENTNNGPEGNQIGQLNFGDKICDVSNTLIIPQSERNRGVSPMFIGDALVFLAEGN